MSKFTWISLFVVFFCVICMFDYALVAWTLVFVASLAWDVRRCLSLNRGAEREFAVGALVERLVAMPKPEAIRYIREVLQPGCSLYDACRMYDQLDRIYPRSIR